MIGLLSQLGLFTAYALVGGSVAFVLAVAMEKNLPLSPRIRKWLYLVVLMLPAAIFGIHALTPCQISPGRILPAICRITGPYVYWLGWGSLLALLSSLRFLRFAPAGGRQWHDARAEALVSQILGDISVKLIDSEYPQAFVQGWLSPVIYLTRGLYQMLDYEELEAVLKHEVAHVRSADNLLNILATVFRSLSVLSPVAHTAFDKYEEAREAAADEAVANSLGLASALVKVGKRGILLQTSLSSCLRSDSVTGRIENLLAGHVRDSLRWIHIGLLASILIVLFIC